MKRDNHFTANIGFRSIENGVIVSTSVGPAYGPQRASGEVYYSDAASALADLAAFIPAIKATADEVRAENDAKAAEARKAKP